MQLNQIPVKERKHMIHEKITSFKIIIIKPDSAESLAATSSSANTPSNRSNKIDDIDAPNYIIKKN